MPTPGPLELIIILVIALLILGPGKLPDVGSSLGKSIREFRKASSDVQEAAKVDTSPPPPIRPPRPLPQQLPWHPPRPWRRPRSSRPRRPSPAPRRPTAPSSEPTPGTN